MGHTWQSDAVYEAITRLESKTNLWIWNFCRKFHMNQLSSWRWRWRL